MIEGEIHPLKTAPKSKGIGRGLKRAALVGLATTVPLFVGKETVPQDSSSKPKKIIEKSASFDSRAPHLVPVDELPNQIEFATDTLRANDTNIPEQVVAIDTVRSDIEKSYASNTGEHATATSLEKKQVEVSIDTLERYIRDIVNEGLKNAANEVRHDEKGRVIKKNVKTTLQSLHITKQGEVLNCDAVLNAKKGFFLSFDIKVNGTLFSRGNTLALSDPKIHAYTDGIAQQAEEQIMPVWDTIIPMLGMRLMREHKSEGKPTTTIGGNGLKYEFTPKKE